MRPITLSIAMFDRGWPAFMPGKTMSPVAISFISFSTATAAAERGTLCSVSVFVLGIVHTRAPRSTCGHVMGGLSSRSLPMMSPVRTAQRIASSSARAAMPWRDRKSSMKVPTWL